MLNWLNRQLGEHAPMVAVIAVLTFSLSAGLAYNFVRNFEVNDNGTHSSEVQRDRLGL
jgi:hypothetical protein